MDTALLLSQLSKGHQAILFSVNQICLFIRDYNRAKPHLRVFESQLLAQYSLQNKEFFAELNRLHANNPTGLKMLEALQTDLLSTKIQLLEFFEKHTGEMNDHHSASFPVDWANFSAVVIGRVHLEEEYLLPLMKTSL